MGVIFSLFYFWEEYVLIRGMDDNSILVFIVIFAVGILIFGILIDNFLGSWNNFLMKLGI
jgi:hypothetical protein